MTLERPIRMLGNMIQARGLTKTYGSKTVVDNLSFDVPSGVVTGFLGPNGAGKSTTMRMLMGLDIAERGTSTLNGKQLRDIKQPMREVGVLLDAGYLHPTRTARNHLLAMAYSNGLKKSRVDEVLAMVGLSDVADNRVGTFSLGMKQRIGLAGTLLGDPSIIILDEPANGLDPEGVHWIRTFLAHLAAEGRTVFVSSHLLSEMALMAERLVVIGGGKLIAETTVNGITADASGASVLVRSPQIDELLVALTYAGVVTEREGDGIAVTGWNADQIGRLAFEQHIELHELSTRTPTLESAFLELTASSQEYRTEPVTNSLAGKA
jgi:ABC-2 type transport system ATP-binding protein